MKMLWARRKDRFWSPSPAILTIRKTAGMGEFLLLRYQTDCTPAANTKPRAVSTMFDT